MIARLFYNDGTDDGGNPVVEVIDRVLRDSDDPKDESEKLISDFLENGPPSEIWFAFETCDTVENIYEVKEQFWTLIRPQIGRGKFSKTMRIKMEEIKKVLESGKSELV